MTTISFDVPRADQVTLNVFNITGQLVRKMLDEKLAPGKYSIPFDASNLPSGTYIYSLEAPGYQDSKKCCC